MAVEAYLPTAVTVLTTAAIDSINPCAIGTLILMISVVLAATKSVKKMLLLGGLYISAVMVTYLLAGLGLLYFLASIPLWITELISIIVGVLIVFAGILEVKDFFWYGKWLSLTIPGRFLNKIKTLSKRTTIPGVVFLGIFVSAVELPCTGAPYLAVIALLSVSFNASAFLLLIFYNLIFVLPLIIILILVALGVKLQRINQWKVRNKPYMRLMVGLLLIALGWLLMLIANGTINLG